MNGMLSTVEHAPFSVIDKIWLTPLQFTLAAVMVACLVYCLYRANKTTTSIFSGITALFVIAFVWQSISLNQSREFVFFSLRSNTAIAARKGRKLTLITDLEPNSKTFQYSIKPYLDSCGVDTLSLKSPKDSFSTNHITHNKNSLDALGYLILLLDNYQPNIGTATYNFIYIINKVQLNDINSLKSNSATWILRPARFADQDSVIRFLNEKRIKYMMNGSNKALVIPSKQ